MKYKQPFGVTDENAGYVNGNPAIGMQGSIPPAAAFEYPMREIVALIAKSGFTPIDADLQQVLKAVRSHRLNYVIDSSVTSGDIIVNPDPPLDEYTVGLELNVAVSTDCPGASRINVSGLGYVSVIRSNGAATQEGDYDAGMILSVVFDGVAFEIKNYRGFTSETENTNNYYHSSIPFSLDTGTPNAIYATFSATNYLSPTKGDLIEVAVANDVTGATTVTIEITGVGAQVIAACPVTRWDGSAIQAGDIEDGENILLSYEGTYWQLMNPLPYSALFTKFPYAKDIGPVNQLQATYAPSVGTVLYDGLAVLCKAGHAPTANITFSPNGLTAKYVKWPNGTSVGAGTFGVNAILFLVYDIDDDFWQLLSVISPGSTFPFFPQVGSYCMATPNPRAAPFTDTLSSPVMPGTSVPGSSLIVNSSNYSGGGSVTNNTYVLPGTWMSCGGIPFSANADQRDGSYVSNGPLPEISLWQRVG